jgi:CHAT domain-containing protein/Flp pilus assembly protein TadD
MGPRCLAIVCLVLAGCGTSPDDRYQKGRLLLKQDRLDEAMAQAEAGLRAEGSWRFRILKADILFGRSDVKAAREALAFRPRPSDPEWQARLLMDEAWLEILGSDNEKAEAELQEATRIAALLPQPTLPAIIEMRLGYLRSKMGRADLAEPALRHALEVFSAQGEPKLEAAAMNNLGYLFLNTFRLEDAIYWFERAGAKLQQAGSVDLYTLGNLGSCYQRLGDSDRALTYFQEAEMQARQAGDHYLQQLWIGNSGDILSESGDLAAAAEKFKQALAIGRSRDKDEKDLTGWWYYSLASVSIELRDFDAAEKYNQESIRLRKTIGDHSDYFPRINEAHIAAGRGKAAAEELYNNLIAEYRAGMDPIASLEAQTGLAALLAAKGELDRADAQYRAALTQLESQRTALVKPENRMTYLAKLIGVYDRYINFLVDRKQPERALEVAESSRARVLDERLESKSRHASVAAAPIRDLARSSHSVFLSYWLGKKRSFLWEVSADGILLHELPPESQIASLVGGYRAFLENLRDPLASEYPAGRKLSEILLGPVKTLLTTSARIVVVPDRSLHALNFETLPDPADPSKYLIERATLEVAPSLDLLAESRTAARPADSLLLIGNPEQAVEEFPRLPFAGSEIEKISKTFAPQNETVLQGVAAFPNAYREAHPEQFSWIHFAAHAAANRNIPLDSALILSRHGSSYQLLARDVMNMPLNATLVTLSACRGAGAKTYSGEGQVGLSWAFLRAGARSVVAGLWDVTDRSTAELMADFYAQLAQHASPADALRHAKLALLSGGKPYNKPFYWGPFELYAGTI